MPPFMYCKTVTKNKMAVGAFKTPEQPPLHKFSARQSGINVTLWIHYPLIYWCFNSYLEVQCMIKQTRRQVACDLLEGERQTPKVFYPKSLIHPYSITLQCPSYCKLSYIFLSLVVVMYCGVQNALHGIEISMFCNMASLVVCLIGLNVVFDTEKLHTTTIKPCWHITGKVIRNQFVMGSTLNY